MSRLGYKIFGWLAAAATCALPLWAQYPGRVDTTQQQDTTHLRATAVLEYTGDLPDPKQSRLIPVAVWDGTHYQPGGLYLAQPAPLAVLSGTQYEMESDGQLKGLFNISEAENLGGHWIGVGKYLPPPVARPKPPKSKHMPYQIRDADPDKPHFAHRPADETSQSGSASAAQAAPPVDPNRPTLHDRPNSGDTSGSSASTQPDVDPDRPTFHRRSESSPANTTASAPQPTTDPNRPRLVYSAPTEQLKLDKPDALAGLPADMKQIAGVSDTRPPERISWTFSWSNPEDADKMKTALEQVAEQAVAPPPPPAPKTTAKTRSAHHKAARPQAPQAPMLTDEDFRAFSLSFGGGATMVFSARTASTPAKYVTIIAQPDFYGQPQILLKQVTNENEMDVIPRMRLVDAVDTQGTGRADLIFELRGRTWREFAIYRIDAGSATQAFVTQPTAQQPAGE